MWYTATIVVTLILSFLSQDLWLSLLRKVLLIEERTVLLNNLPVEAVNATSVVNFKNITRQT